MTMIEGLIEFTSRFSKDLIDVVVMEVSSFHLILLFSFIFFYLIISFDCVREILGDSFNVIQIFGL